MAEKHTKKYHPKRRRSFIILFIAALVVITALFNFSSLSRPRFIDRRILPNTKLHSISEDQDAFKIKDKKLLLPVIHTNVYGVPEAQTCDPTKRRLKVFMYDLDPKFHFGLLNWTSQSDNVWPDIETKIPKYAGGLNLQHSTEYYLTLDLLFNKSCGAVRVKYHDEAEYVFVPNFPSLSYNRNAAKSRSKVNADTFLQEELVMYVKEQKEWRKYGGKDHIFVAHHPNSMLYARKKLPSSIYILADLGRYPKNVANTDKDVIAPYKHLVRTFVNDASGFDDRKTLIYFQGAIVRKAEGAIRRELYKLLKDEPDVHFSQGSFGKNGIQKIEQGMRSSKFCLSIAGDTPSSNRLFDAIASQCVPVIISDNIELPFEDVLDYSEFCIFVKSEDAVKEDFLVDLVRGVTKEEWTKMWKRLKEVDGFFEYRFPSREGDAVHMIWQEIGRKTPTVQYKLHKAKRFSRFKEHR